MSTKPEIQELRNVLNQVFSKVYMRTITSLLHKLEKSEVELTSEEKQAIHYLVQDIRGLDQECKKKSRGSSFY